MFHLFRRHQKVLLTSIATVAIGSMIFSAIAPIFMDQNPQTASSKDLNKNLNDTFISLFNHSFDGAEDKLIFPEAIFSQTLLDTGILRYSAFILKESIAQDLDETFIKIAQHEPKQVLEGMTQYQLAAKINPKIYQLITEMKAASNTCFETKLDLLIQFFKEKQKVPAFMLHQYIQVVSKGQSLVSSEDLEWFGLKTLEDFFGKRLMMLATENFVRSLEQNIKGQDGFKVMQKYQAKLSHFYGTNVHPNQYFIAINIDPKVGLEALKTIEALTSLKTTLSDSLLLDPSTHGAFYDFATKKVPVTAYSFNKHMQMQSLEDVALCELYAKQKQTLLYDKYEIKIRSLDKTKAFARLPKKQIYTEALKQYQELSSLMPYALSAELISEKEKLEAIKNLNDVSKALFDRHMQKALFKNQPQFFHNGLNELTPQSKTLFFTKDSRYVPLEGFNTVQELKKELEILPLNTPVIFDLGTEFMHEIELVSKQPQEGLLTFNQALESGVLKDTLKHTLEGCYKELVKKSSHKFLNADKKIKSLDQAYLDVLEVYHQDLKKKLSYELNVAEDLPSKFLIKAYPKLVLASYKSQKDKIEDFRIEKQTLELSRHETLEPSCIKLFDNKQDVLSDVILTQDGSYVFYEKTGGVTEGEPVLKKDALEALVQEKLSLNLLSKIKL